MTSEQRRPSDYLMVRMFAQRWADGTLRQAARLRDVLRRVAELDKAYERMDDMALTERDIAAKIDEVWVEQHLLLIAAHQFEKWVMKMIELRDDVRPDEQRLMRLLRNSLEHLDEAELTELEALPGSEGNRNRSIRDLPDGRLPLGVTLGSNKVMIFDLIKLDDIEKSCQQVADQIFEEITGPDVESYIDWMIDDTCRR